MVTAALKNITVSYSSTGRTVIRNFSLKIPEGKNLVLMGPNGAGKSTVLSVLAGLKFPDSGEYTYRGRSVTKKSLSGRLFPIRFRRETALMFQNPDVMLFNPTVTDELLFGPRQFHLAVGEEEISWWLRESGLEKYRDTAPYLLSGGEKKRLALISLLIMKPRLLLLDEPTAGLDTEYTEWVFDLLQRHRKQFPISVVFTTHESCLHKGMGKNIVDIQ
jgi:cobalt/nickel transport system ATP-binding protein